MAFNEIDVDIQGKQVGSQFTYKEVVLKPNFSFAEQVTKANRKYVIKWDFDLGGQTITIPKKCLLKFDGGSLANGTIIGQNTVLIYYQGLDDIFKNIIRQGTFVYNNALAGVKRYGATNERPAIVSNIYEGFQYFDTTLGKPIWIKEISDNTITWVDATGTTV